MKTIAIVGATGNQGMSVARTFLSLGDWKVRCLTRNPTSPTAQGLASEGAVIVKADLSEIESLSSAFEGAHVIFSNTDFWGPYRSSGDNQKAYDIEVEHGKNAAIAAAGVPTLERFVYSILGPMKKHSNGKYSTSYHWDTKAEVKDYIETELPALAAKTSYIILGAYTTNPLFVPRWDDSVRRYRFFVPLKEDTKLPIIATTESTGPFVKGLVDEAPRTRLLAYDSYLSMREVVDLWSKVTGVKADLVVLTYEQMHTMFNVPWEVLSGPAFIQEYGYTGGIEDVIHPSQLGKPVKTESFEGWLRKQDWNEVITETRKELEWITRSPSGQPASD
ncbi:hypothetical protein BDV59DRAFT_3214 [Aspergillus ambiguus]|uniref:uncharacterized protein n=1 Tax=Aspergillus ambiguus TaxID=176160 RepID=UPI003CCE183A